ncbi:GPI ethanolamine phosphate transferase 3 [Galendromus occidentalis]|uniref:GPI ethanolamine phosphate transferase 3 n=1 Tax=Galendromus occidentalis TaxID=34638 RepID=A0AAJ6QNY3_9ACAR|nr:GPI ethanolamine phosphate transferase 3 [Galendromus occidentalis]
MVANFRHGSTLFLVFIGAYLFCRGFFLHRNLSQKTSTCNDLHEFHQIESHGLPCWSNRRYDRVVVLVIDALKYDFTVYQEDSTAYWANRMPIFEKLRSHFPRQTFHARFVADSPTTTLQRLTALLTGSMPTFIDAATNFYQTSVNEDNLVRQMKLNNLSVVFMGDDTWMSLLPDSFKRSYPYPSFVVHDLHTVDDGVLSHIYEELATDDADVLIAHFLGVDHCGHWYHQDHPEMGSKLSQMNEVVANVSRQLRTGDLLVVFGDHGMTLSGDHGGDTDEEKTSALFMFAPGTDSLVKYYDITDDPKVSQIDIVPSLSLLMGIPIPFSSLGMLIEPLFLSRPLDGRELVPLWINAQQVQRYVNTSSHLLKLIPLKVNQLNRLWDVLAVNFNDTLSARALYRAATDYLSKVQSVARSAFTVFNIPYMGLGVVHLTVASLIATLGAMKDVELSSTENSRERSLYCWVVVIETAVVCLGHFSNSFIINEDLASLFMLQGILLMILAANRNLWKRLFIVGLMILLRVLSPLGSVCRHEQGCKVTEDQPGGVWFVLAAASVIASVAFARHHVSQTFGKSFSLSASAPAILSALYIAALTLLSYWFLQTQDPKKIHALATYIHVLPNVSAVCSIFFQVLLVLHRKFAKDRVILHLNYVILHTLGLWLLLSVYTTPRHVPSLFVHAVCLLLMFLTRAVPEELEGALVAALMTNTFFATGHQNTFQQIQWKAGFVGAAGSSLVVPGIRVVLNTFSGQILTGFLLPAVMRKHISRSSLIAILVTRLTHQCVACFILRQHLMLWAVFATKLLFTIVEMTVLLLSIALGILICKNSAYWTLGHLSLLENTSKKQTEPERPPRRKSDRLKK